MKDDPLRTLGRQRLKGTVHHPPEAAAKASPLGPYRPPRRRTGGRSAKVKLAILAAAERLVAPDPFVDLSTGRLASEAGVSYTTVARGWQELRHPIARLRALRLLDSVHAERGEADDSTIKSLTSSLAEKLTLQRLDAGDLVDFLQALDQMIRERLEEMRQHSPVTGSALPSTQWIVAELIAPIVYWRLTGATDLPDLAAKIALGS